MLRGTRIIQGDELHLMMHIVQTCGTICYSHGFQPIQVPNIWENATFIHKPGMRYIFPDKKGRECCLVPEATAPLIEAWNAGKLDDDKVFYIQRCYRYERPQAGRYREFTQFGVEAFNDECVKDVLKECLDVLGVAYAFHENVQRGIDYYTDDGYEAECEALGAQKQIAGGGRYKEGSGWAIGVDRIALALKD